MITKQEAINVYKDLCNKLKVSKISRDLFRSSQKKVTENTIKKLFGTFSKFKQEIHNKELDNSKSKDFSSKSLIANSYLDLTDHVKFNKTTADYIFNFEHVNNIAKTIIIPETQLYAMLQAYSSFDDDPKTIEEIALKFKYPTFIIKKIFQELDFTHEALPITNNLLENNKDDNEVVEDLYALRKSNIFSKFKEKTWQCTQADAQKWNMFEDGYLNPFKDILDTWKPPSYTPIKYTKANRISNSTYIVTLSDLHFGSKCESEYAYYCNGKEWTIKETEKAIVSYINSIDAHLKTLSVVPDKCVLISLGDILHSISGYTDKGTMLDVDPKGPIQFKIALDSISKIIDYLSSKFSQVTINTVNGNHDSFADWVLFTALEKYYKNNKNIVFNISTTRWHGFTIGLNLFIIEHGYSPFYKSKVPKAYSAKEAYIQRLILQETQNQLKKGNVIKNRYFMMGDLHHHSYTDFPMFEFIQLPTIVKSDKYSDNLNLVSRPKQLTFICDHDKGLINSISHFI